MEQESLQAGLLKVRENEGYRERVQEKRTVRESIDCPKCGAANDISAAFCENCGHPLGQKKCPYCQAHLEPGADICEHCHRYVLADVCSFCGSSRGVEDLFCPECGASRDGIVCPVCHTHNLFSVCVSCGTPLIDSARLEVAELRQSPAYVRMRTLSKELEKLQKLFVPTSPDHKARWERCEEIRRRVLDLLGDDNHLTPVEPAVTSVGSEEELAELISQKREELQALLDKLSSHKQPNAAISRRYMLACRPPLSRLGWRCNFKNELHRGPQDCACPQMGGTWIVVEGAKETELNGK
ncbi:MAG: zinc ribbon domain-containing protein [Bacteroidaceae bacterium]|nr:zinc ribbon domain-containing protein [Bacteroidaceae bacterium]